MEETTETEPSSADEPAPPAPTSARPRHPDDEPLFSPRMKRTVSAVVTTAITVWGAAWWMVDKFGDRIAKVEERLSVIESKLDGHLEWHRSGVGAAVESESSEDSSGDEGEPDAALESDPEAVLGGSGSHSERVRVAWRAPELRG